MRHAAKEDGRRGQRLHLAAPRRGRTAGKSVMRKRGEDGLSPIGAIMRRAGLAPPSAHKLRLIDAAATIAAGEDDREIAYHHTVFCQTALPYRHVEDRIWERTNGFLSLSIEAGRALHPETQKWVELPLPYGPKARLIPIGRAHELDREPHLGAQQRLPVALNRSGQGNAP